MLRESIVSADLVPLFRDIKARTEISNGLYAVVWDDGVPTEPPTHQAGDLTPENMVAVGRYLIAVGEQARAMQNQGD